MKVLLLEITIVMLRVSQCLSNGVMITRLKPMPAPIGPATRDKQWQPRPALKVCITTGISKKDTERAGVIIRHAITKIVTKRRA
jgi:serine palmitoyltransferase